jgi:hypothetical protein
VAVITKTSGSDSGRDNGFFYSTVDRQLLAFFLEGRLQVICFLSKASKKIKNKKGPGGVGLSLALATGLF